VRSLELGSFQSECEMHRAEASRQQLLHSTNVRAFHVCVRWPRAVLGP
jgi:hypothetical protein